MATLSAALKPNTNVAADFQAWAQFIENTLTGGGWLVTADTGQTLPSALPSTTGSAVKAGYRVYRMNDSLQATFPVFLRIDYGTTQFGAGTCPGIWPTIGTGSDGSGGITGKMYDVAAGNPPLGTSGASTTAYNCYGSASAGRVTHGMFITEVNGNVPWGWGLERTKDSQGNDTGAGLLMLQGGIATGAGLRFSNYLIYGTAPGGQPAQENGISYIISSKAPSETFAPGDLGVGVIIHFKGVSQQPGINFLMSNSSDVPLFGIINTTIYGVTHSYVQLGFYMSGHKRVAATGSDEGNSRSLMRYD